MELDRRNPAVDDMPAIPVRDRPPPPPAAAASGSCRLRRLKAPWRGRHGLGQRSSWSSGWARFISSADVVASRSSLTGQATREMALLDAVASVSQANKQSVLRAATK